MERLIAVARSLRVTHQFGGYIHLKAVAGCSGELTRAAGLWADRVSANIELPRPADLTKLAPAKTHAQVEQSMGVLQEAITESLADGKRGRAAFAPAGQSTQLIVGATDASDCDILDKAVGLYKKFHLRRVYFTAYSPIPHSDSALPQLAPPLVREHRLYQADWLVRHYGFGVGELTTPAAPNLDLTRDPKLAWALQNRQVFPVDVNKADRNVLLRVPGLGVRTVERILAARRFRGLTLEDLRRMGASLKKAKFFIQAREPNPFLKHVDSAGLDAHLRPEPVQLSLFETATAARTGEL